MQEQIQKQWGGLDNELDEIRRIADPTERYVLSIKAVIRTMDD